MKRFLNIVSSIIFIIFVFLCFSQIVFADEEMPKSLGELQTLRSRARLFLPNFVIIGEKATFKIVTKPFYNVELNLDYDNLESEIYTTKANDMGLAIFEINIIDDKNLVGKSVLTEAYVWDDNNELNKSKAIPQDNNKIGNSTLFDRVYITDKDTAKGFLVSPSQMLNQYLLNNNLGRNADNYNVYNNPYSDDTPAYVRNMRDARDNVRQVRQTINNSNR